MTATYQRSGGFAALLAGAAIALAACSGSSPASAGSPTVASLGTSASDGGSSTTTAGASSTTMTTGGGSSATAPGADRATQLLNEWTDCIRSHGDPNQADPIIDTYGVINITMHDVSATLSNQVHGGGSPCASYLSAASNALRAADPVAPPPDNAESLGYVDCVRANGSRTTPTPAPTGRPTSEAPASIRTARSSRTPTRCVVGRSGRRLGGSAARARRETSA